MKLTIHRGAHQIGGSCVEIEANGTRILVDFGMPLHDTRGADFNDRALHGKPVQALIDDGVLFNIKGLYSGSTPSIDAVFVSHSHKDHYGLLSYINPNIPVYISKGAYELVRALGAFLPAAKPIANDTPTFLKHRRPIKIGGCEVTPYLVDHSGFDAMGFLIRETATGKTVLYTGDFRAGGWTKYRYNDVISKPPARVDCLLMEGTTLEREGGKYPNEVAVVQGVADAVHNSKNTVLPVYCSGQNIDRIVSLYKAALKAGALLVVDPYTAYMLKVAGEVAPSIPQIEWRNVRVFVANYGRGDIYINKISKSDRKEIIPSLGKKKIKAFDFGSLKQKALLVMRNTMIPVVEKIPEIRGSTLIYSQWQGYIKKNTSDSRKFWAFADSNDLKVEHIHASGHATLEILQEFAAKMNPRQIVPIHTEHPAEFRKYFGNAVVRHEDRQSFEV